MTENHRHSYNLRNRRYKLVIRDGDSSIKGINNNGSNNNGDSDDYINLINSENKDLL